MDGPGQRRRPARPLLPRPLHPGAWWLWALGLATVATRTFNPLLLGLVLVVAGYVVAARRTAAPWARSFAMFLKLGLVVLTIRLVFQVVLGVAQGDTLLFTLPEADLPDWAAGVTLGGSVTLESVVAAFVDGLRLATILACVGAANALANPKRLLASMPSALYEIGVAVVVALSFAPSLVGSVQRIRAARRLRGRPDRGLRSVLSVALPVVEDALERSLALAAAMDSRGYGRRADVPVRVQRLTGVLTLTGLLGTSVGVYGMLDTGSPVLLGLPALVFGLVAGLTGVRLAGRRTVRSRYRPDPWAAPERLTAGVGVLAAVAAFVGGMLDPVSLEPAFVPLTAPSLPLVPTLGLLAALLPAWLTPPPTLSGGNGEGTGSHAVGADPGDRTAAGSGPRVEVQT
ncbi:cobalt ABC transporter permease [Egicoccus halophilus]|uniref:Cobalt ABC transporter permease n=2 Tax=Egicoccus halophilus TaxID=1670830 RepID=A0A8J3ACW3_9ACTN|nr:energy-coupling factor transporter transmembrane component T [Egicoccus halophilus]GGI09139.1 cobalt ABC transporter permease [Egicoccus halophilus]